ncbi:2-oxoglutarate and iron-dependent oxygenase domain-containing protein [Moorena sp. SIO3B2]|uniref:2-oxoglutarate and iron-dependent oxygenase domain-containing protein n=1 Tax=Moorena sp. SIO3B2 TaxID=2607827 RepID=UPI0013CD6BB8|nr:2-oxoglutarate and iron-dependent oxygenase domain-containing protein [Moorena sp. SIO3B2]NEP31346.1 hypothetical protein [Moorena sp. SIO3B2]
MNTLPVISLAKLKYINGLNSCNEEHKRLSNICLDHGFFYLKYHGISADLFQQTIDRSRNFFQLPQDIKKAYGQDKQTVYPNTSRGYVPVDGEILHEDVGPDSKELFDQGNRTSTFRQAVYWPDLDS